MKFKTAYIDGDLLLYAIGFATQKNIYHIYVDGQLVWVDSDKRKINRIFKGIPFGYEKYINVEPPFSAVQTYRATLAKYRRMFQTKDLVVVLTGDSNFRDEVATTRPYKGTRKGDKPENYPVLKEYMLKHGAVVTEDEEADDYISYMTYNNYDVVAVTSDKDALNTPSYIYNADKEKLIYVSEEDATKHFWHQVITGDGVDNIPGLPGVGEAALAGIYEGCTTYKEYRCAAGLAYAAHPRVSDPEGYLREQGQLLWMRRKEGEMWDLEYDQV